MQIACPSVRWCAQESRWQRPRPSACQLRLAGRQPEAAGGSTRVLFVYLCVMLWIFASKGILRTSVKVTKHTLNSKCALNAGYAAPALVLTWNKQTKIKKWNKSTAGTFFSRHQHFWQGKWLSTNLWKARNSSEKAHIFKVTLTFIAHALHLILLNYLTFAKWSNNQQKESVDMLKSTDFQSSHSNHWFNIVVRFWLKISGYTMKISRFLLIRREYFEKRCNHLLWGRYLAASDTSPLKITFLSNCKRTN